MSAEIDVVVVNYHSAEALRRNLHTVMEFVGADARLVIVNNSHEENLHELIADWQPHAKVISPGANLGFAAAVNLALPLCSADLILLANPDSRVLSGAMSTIAARFAGDARIACLGVKLMSPNGRVQRSCKRSPSPLRIVSESLGLTDHWPCVDGIRLAEWEHDEAKEVDALTGAFVFLKGEAVADVGRLDERFFMYYEETDWMLRARQKGWKVFFEPAVEVIHDGGASSSVPSSYLGLMLIKSEQQYLRKHFGLASAFAVQAALCAAEIVRMARACARGNDLDFCRALSRLRVHLTSRVPAQGATGL